MAAPLSMSELSPALVDVKVTTSYGRVLEVPMKMLSWFEWNECVAHVIEPMVPRNRLNPANGQKELPNPDDGPYKLAYQQYIHKRNYIRLLKALMDAGNFPELAGKSEDERIETFIKNTEVAVAFKLLTALDNAVQGGQQRVQSLTDSFQPSVSPVDHADSPAVGVSNGTKLAVLAG